MANEKIITQDVFEQSIKDILTLLVNNTYNFTEYTDEEVGNLIDLDPTQIAELTAVISDSVVAKNKVFSSSHTTELIQKSIIESNEYADSLVANLSNIKLDIVDTLPDASTVNKSTIYILKDSTGGTNNTLNVWSDSTSAFVEVGKLDVNMDSYYTKSDVDTLLADKADNNNVVHQEDIVSNLTTTSGTTTLSTAGLQTELDKKANDDEVLKKTDINDTTASSNSVFSSNKVVSLFNDIKLYSRDNGGLIKHDDIGGWYSNTRVEKYGRLCSAYFNVTWNDNANSRVYVCTLSDAVKPTDTIACNCVTNNGVPAYLFIDESGVVGIAKPTDEAKTDGIRVPFTYFSSEI